MFATLLCALLAVPAANKVSATNPSALHKPHAPAELAPKFELDGVLMPAIHSAAGLPKAGTKSAPGSLDLNLAAPTKAFSNWLKACKANKCEKKALSVIFLSAGGIETGRINLYEVQPTAEVASPARAGQPVHSRMTVSYKSFEFKSDAKSK